MQTLKTWQMILVALLLVVAGFFAAVKKVKTELPVFGEVSAFTFQDQKGREFSSEELKGKVWAAGFIFTRCQGPCPVISARMNALKKRLNYSSKFANVSFSIDPGYDTPEVLAAYAARFQDEGRAEWHFLTGPQEKIHVLAEQVFKQTAAEDPSQKDIQARFMHGTRIALVDGNGQIRGFYDSQSPDAVKLLERDARSIL